jgi:hypothetical protein
LCFRGALCRISLRRQRPNELSVNVRWFWRALFFSRPSVRGIGGCEFLFSLEPVFEFGSRSPARGLPNLIGPGGDFMLIQTFDWCCTFHNDKSFLKIGFQFAG